MFTFKFETDAETVGEMYDDLLAAWYEQAEQNVVKPAPKAKKSKDGSAKSSAKSMAAEARHQARKAAEAEEAAKAVDEEAAERLGWPRLVVEVLEFTDPLTFVYSELVPSSTGTLTIPLSDQGFWSAKDKGTYHRHISPMLDLDRHIERRDSLASNGFHWAPWQDLPTRLRWWIIAHVLPHSWAQNQETALVVDPAMLDRVMVFVKGNLP